MEKTKNLNKKQLALIDDLLPVDTERLAILKKHNITANTYYKWLTDECFYDELKRRLLALNRQREIIIAGYASDAAGKLKSLADCEKEQTVRQACLDIINMLMQKAQQIQEQNDSNDDTQCPPISDETAGKLLAVLAEAED